jgi:peptidase E
MERGKILLSSQGLDRSKKLQEEIKKDTNLSDKSIMLFCEPFTSVLRSLIPACERLGFAHIYTPDEKDANELLKKVNYIYVTEGNTFAILSNLRNPERPFDKKIREAVLNGACYIGASAGAAIAGKSVEHVLEFDPNYKRLTNFEGLGLVDGLIFPHMDEKTLKKYRKEYSERLYCIKEEEVVVL